MSITRALLLFLLLSRGFSFSQMQYLGGAFSSEYVKVTNQDTVFAGKYRSYDNGDSWTQIHNYFANLDNYFNSQIGIVTNLDTLFKTTDGGDSWTEVAQVSGVNEITFTDNGNVLYGWRDFPSWTGPASKLIKSTDGGSSWIDMSLPFETIGADTMHCASMSVVSEDTVFYLLTTTVPYYIVFKTFDGGTTWDTTTTPFSGAFTIPSFFVTGSLGFVANGNEVHRTTDAGETWNMTTHCVEVWDMSFVDDQVGYFTGFPLLCSSDFHTYKTTDGGQNWVDVEICEPCGDTSYVGYAIDALYEDYFFSPAFDCDGIYRYEGDPCPVIGLEENSEETILISPNPASDIIRIEASSEIEIFDAFGRVVYQGASGEINISSWESGVYILRTSTEQVRLIKL